MNPLKIGKIMERVLITIHTFPLFDLGQKLLVYDNDTLSVLIQSIS